MKGKESMTLPKLRAASEMGVSDSDRLEALSAFCDITQEETTVTDTTWSKICRSNFTVAELLVELGPWLTSSDAKVSFTEWRPQMPLLGARARHDACADGIRGRWERTVDRSRGGRHGTILRG